MSEIYLGETLVERREVPLGHRMSLLEHLYVEKGTIDDWRQLEALHYKSAKLGVGPRFIRCVLDQDGKSETIGVMVFTTPKFLDGGRNEVFPHLKPNRDGVDNTLINRTRANWVNRNILLSSRTVLDTMYRGAGIAYRFKNIGYRMTGFRFIESRSSMSRFNPFSEKAGMRFVRPRAASGQDQGLLFLSRNFKTASYDYLAISQELQSMNEATRARVLDDMRDFYYRHSAMEKSGDKRLEGKDRVNTLPTDYLIRQVLQLTLGATVYALFQNPDHGRELPSRIPITAFDNQGVLEPLRLDLL